MVVDDIDNDVAVVGGGELQAVGATVGVGRGGVNLDIAIDDGP